MQVIMLGKPHQFHIQCSGKLAGNQNRLQATNPEAKLWIDFVRVQGKRTLQLTSEPIFYQRLDLTDGNLYEYNLRGYNADVSIWNITDHNNVFEIIPNTNNNVARHQFRQLQDVNQFVAFNKQSTNFSSPTYEESLQNQNLHAESPVNYIIITHPLFKSQADRLGEFHRTQGLSVGVYEIDKNLQRI